MQKYVVIVFFNERRTDYIVRGPFDSTDAAQRGLDYAKRAYKAAVDIQWVEVNDR